MRLSRCAGAFACAIFAVTMAPACSSTAGVGDIWTSPDADGARRRNIFYTDTKDIYCLAQVGVGRADVTLEMIIRYLQLYEPADRKVNNTNIVATYHEEKPQKSTDRPSLVGIKLIPSAGDGKPDENLPYPVGRGQCEVYIDGNLEGTAVFNIGFPPCPSASIVSGGKCGGYYEEGKDCPLFGESGDPTNRCRCDGGVWQC
jgi:hypothetical protein